MYRAKSRYAERHPTGPWCQRNLLRNREIEGEESCRWCDSGRVHKSEFCRVHRPIAARGEFNMDAKAQTWAREREAAAILRTADAQAEFLSDADGETERTAVTLSGTGDFATYAGAVGEISIGEAAAIKWCPTRAYAEAWAAAVNDAGIEAEVAA